MQYQANANSYLTTEVFTAPPQKLQLMLIQMAIRQVARAKREWQAGETGEACQTLLHAQQIVDQLIAGVNREASPELADRVLSVYDFISRRLREANTERDTKKLDDVSRVLEIERETWQLICDKLGGKTSTQQVEFISAQAKSPAPAPVFDSLDGLAASGFSLEA
jgi:flagellar secretion chaperone FliS